MPATDGVEQVGSTGPCRPTEEAGAEPELVSLGGGDEHHLSTTSTRATRGRSTPSSAGRPRRLRGAGAARWGVDGDFVRADPDAVAFVTSFFEAGKPVAATATPPGG